MSTTKKTGTLNFWIDLDLRGALRAVAQHEYRSVAKVIAVLIRDFCERLCIAIISPQDTQTAPWSSQNDQND